MRLWHYKLIQYLPKQQLIAQWRELNSIFKKQDKHILINYIYDYGKVDLYAYAKMVIYEIENRGYKIRSYQNFYNYFNDLAIASIYYPFEKHHNNEFLKICVWNLWEKYIRGQNGFSKQAIKYFKEVMENENI